MNFVSYLANNLRRLGIINCLEILLHGTVIIPLLVKKIGVSPIYSILLQDIHSGLLGQIDREHEKISLA